MAKSIEIIYQKGYAINKRVGAVINSANGFLLLGTSGAGAIREKSRSLITKEKDEYRQILMDLPASLKNDYQRVYLEHRWTPTYAQLGCLRLLAKKAGNEFKRGDAVLQTEWSKTDKRPIIHAVCMSYKLGLHRSSRLPATPMTIKNAITKALRLADQTGAKSVALPVASARKTYGVSPAESLKAIKSAISAAKLVNIKKIIICFDNKITEDYLKKIGR